MGYTNYYSTTGSVEKFDKDFIDGVKKIFEACEQRGIKIVGWDGEENTSPELSETRVSFNGCGKLCHETFAISTKEEWVFCKTAQKPYDLAVKTVLMLATKFGYVKADWSFDGDETEEEFTEAKKLYESLFAEQKKKETYSQLKDRQQKEFDKLSNGLVFWAFSNKQFEEGVKSVNAQKNDEGKWILSNIGGGGFAKPEFFDVYNKAQNRWTEERKAFLKVEENAIDALIYEYGNYECQIARDNIDEAIDAVTQGDKELLSEDVKKKAWKIFWKQCCDNDWF